MAQPKAYLDLKAALKNRPLYFWSNVQMATPDRIGIVNDLNKIQALTRCQEHVTPETKGKKLTAREVWNFHFKCDICGYQGGK